MSISLLLEMAVDGFGDRPACGMGADALTYHQLFDRAQSLARVLRKRPGEKVVFLGLNSAAMPVTLLASALAGKPFVPLNYRLSDDQLAALLHRCAPALLVVDEDMLHRVPAIDGNELVDLAGAAGEPLQSSAADEDIAVLLFTSGTTGEPKAAVLRHGNLSSYVMGTVDFMGAEEGECSLVSVPPYHIAAVSNVLSALYAGRRIIQLPAFDPDEWVRVVAGEGVTHAMVVPTMLDRILGVLEKGHIALPALRHLSYGGGRMPVETISRAMEMLPEVDFVNAYGLTETSSTIALLTPQDHRMARSSSDPVVKQRLASVGKPLPSIELEVRDAAGKPVAAGEPGEIFVRGAQVSGEYLGKAGGAAGWFATRDSGYLDAQGYLFLDGRLDDVIVRGGENISPGEIELALQAHPAIAEAAVVGVPSVEWGEAIAAVVVARPGHTVDPAELRSWVAARLRSSKAPALVVVRQELPYSETGKLLRRVLKSELNRVAAEAAI